MLFDTEDLNRHEDPIFSIFQHGLADYGQKFLMQVGTHKPEVFKRLLEYIVEDWGGENRYMLAILGLLNTRNVVQTEKVDHDHLNMKRVRHGKRPLFSYNLLKLRPSVVTGNAGTGGHKDIRLHFVRGHFKHKKNGLFWWSMHTRGNIKHGIVSKDYEVQG